MRYSLVEFIEGVPLKQRGPRRQSFQAPEWNIWDEGMWLFMTSEDTPEPVVSPISNVRMAYPIQATKPVPAPLKKAGK